MHVCIIQCSTSVACTAAVKRDLFVCIVGVWLSVHWGVHWGVQLVHWGVHLGVQLVHWGVHLGVQLPSNMAEEHRQLLKDLFECLHCACVVKCTLCVGCTFGCTLWCTACTLGCTFGCTVAVKHGGGTSSAVEGLV